MPDIWSVWQSQLERLTPFAEEWKEGRVEEFIRNLLNIAAKKRQQRAVILALVEEVKNLHDTYKELLAFFDVERACQSWSAENCEAADVERVVAALTEWRAQLLKQAASFPPSERHTRTLAAMQACVLEAQAAATMIRPCFGVLDAALSSPAAERENAGIADGPAADIALRGLGPAAGPAAHEEVAAAANVAADPIMATVEGEPNVTVPGEEPPEPEGPISGAAIEHESEMPFGSATQEFEGELAVSSTTSKPGETA